MNELQTGLVQLTCKHTERGRWAVGGGASHRVSRSLPLCLVCILFMCESVVSGGPVCVLVHEKRPTDNLPPLLQVELALHVVAPCAAPKRASEDDSNASTERHARRG